jgi:hypothetical protein
MVAVINAGVRTHTPSMRQESAQDRLEDTNLRQISDLTITVSRTSHGIIPPTRYNSALLPQRLPS